MLLTNTAMLPVTNIPIDTFIDAVPTLQFPIAAIMIPYADLLLIVHKTTEHRKHVKVS